MFGAASSRLIVGRSCRRRCCLPPPLPWVVASVTEQRFSLLVNNNNNNNSVDTSANGNHRLHKSSCRVGFSTISFDGNTFHSDALSSESAVDDSTPTFLFDQSPTTSSTSPTSSSPEPITPLTQVPVGNPPPRLKFQQRILHWMASNPKIAPYKAEESLAKLWVEQQHLFRQWDAVQQQQKQTNASSDPVSPPTILLTTESVNLVLHAWCYSNKGELAAERAERLLHWMEDLHHNSSNSESSKIPLGESWSPYLPKPNFQSYATVINAWSQSAAYESSRSASMNSAGGMEAKKSGGRAKNNVVSAATMAGFECAKRAEELLMHMQRMHEQRQLQMVAEDYNGHSEQYSSGIQPDTRVFNLVLKAWSKIRGGTKASAIRAMRILDLMQELHHTQSINAPEWQGMVLSKVQPNLQTYKLVLHAWAHAAHTTEGPDRAEEILRHLLSLSKAGNLGAEIAPDAECFHIAMKAHAESVRKRRKGDGYGSAPLERARKVGVLLDWMELLALRTATSRVRPCTESYRIALSAWVWSHHVDAPKEAEGILFRMIRACDANNGVGSNDGVVVDDTTTAAKAAGRAISGPVRPETRDFNTLINCCSFARKVGTDASEEDDDSLLQRQVAHREIFDIAEGALNALLASEYARPDSATFSGMIRACVNLLPNTEDRDDRVIELFRLAYCTVPSSGAPSSPRMGSSTTSERMRAPPGAGCVDANVLRQLRHALPSTEDYIRVREEFEKHRRRHVGEE